jgi:putative acetyltransferase
MAPKVKPEITPRWKTLLENISYVAEYNNLIVGFGDLTVQGYLDRLFVHKNFQGQGIAAAIMERLESRGKALKIKEITTASSITAKPFFEKVGFAVVKEQHVEVRGEMLTNFVMKKFLVGVER